MKSVRPPLFLTISSGVVAIAIILPFLYLILRAANVGSEGLEELTYDSRYLTIIWNSIGMASAVTFLSALIAVPLAFLTVRTNLPWRRFWYVTTTLPT